MIVTLPPIAATVQRTLSATHLNAVANDPEVRPWLGGDGPLDLTAVIANPDNLAFVTEDGGFVAVGAGDGRYEAHSLFRPAGRGTAAIRAMRAALDYLFTVSDATEVVTKVPEANRAAAGLARLAGFRHVFTSQLPWTGGALVPMHGLSLPIDQWGARSAALAPMGRWLHEQFEAVQAAHASTLPPHSDDDDAHLRMAGAALLMVQAGNALKAAWFYNRWARWTGYPPMRIVRAHPTVLDLGGMVIEARGDQMEVLACQ